MRRTQFLALVLVFIMVLGLCACKSEAAPEIIEASFDEAGRPVINLWVEGSQEEEMAFTELVDAYNALPDRKATVQLRFLRSGIFDAGISARYGEAYTAGEYRGFDIIVGDPTDFTKTVAACGSEDALLAIDPGKLPGLAQVELQPSVYPDRLVAYRANSAVFAYDSAKVPQPPETWDELTDWIKANPGRFTYCDPDFGDAGNAFLTVGLHRLMGDPAAFTDPADAKWADMTDAGFAWLTELHPCLYASGGRIQYPAKDMAALELLSSGEAWMVPAMVDDVLRGLDQQTLPATVKICQLADQPLPGSDMDMAICATTHAADGSYDFLDFVLSAQGQQMLVESLKTIPAVDPAALEQTAETAALAGIDPGALFIMDAGSNGNSYRTRWSEEIATIG